MWIARNLNGTLNIFYSRPFKNKDMGIWMTEDYPYESRLPVNPDLYIEDITWDDDEPGELVIK